MNKHAEIRSEDTPCCVCGHPSVDGSYCRLHQPTKRKEATEKPESRSLSEEFLEK